MNKPRVKIRDWRIVPMNGIGDYYRLEGHTLDHPRLSNAKDMATSYLIKIDFVASEAETRNTIYELVGDNDVPEENKKHWEELVDA